MKKMMRALVDNINSYFFKKKWFSPLAWSVAVHVIFLMVSLVIYFPGVVETSNKTMLEFHLKSVKTAAILSGTPGGGGSYGGASSSGGLFVASPRASNKIKFRSGKKTSLEDAAQDSMSRIPVIPMESRAEQVSSDSRGLDELIFENQQDDAARRLKVPQQSLIQFYEKDAQKSVKASPPGAQGLMRSLSKPLANVEFYSPENMAVDPEEGMPGFTPSGGQGPGMGGSGAGQDRGIGDGAGDGPGGSGMSEGQEEGGGGGLSKYEALDYFMDVEVYVYQDPSDQQKYFMIKIFAKPTAKALPVMPKEILFTIDCSLSISADRLDEFKRGIRYCLTHLNSGDLFNIIAFKDKVIFFSDHSVAADKGSIASAERFVAGLTASQSTDVYSAFSKIIDTPLALNPSNIILISDGRPTHGVVDSRELINSVTRLNNKIRPIFAFTGGGKVNRYLLDFIAYQNRAWSEYVKHYGDIHDGLADFYDKIKDPMLLNLRYRLNNLNTKDVYPKSLPDFYYNAEFTLYGKFTEENDFSMQLLGDMDNQTKELIFTRSLSEAKIGTEAIKRGYAFNKIYDLISRMTSESGDKSKLRAEIEQLSQKYGIKTPYSVELENTR